MDLARQKFEKLIEEEEKLTREGVNIRVIGDLSLLPLDLVKLIARAVCMTRNNKRARLNVAFAYTSRNELTNATRDIVEGLNSGLLDPDDVNADLLEAALYSEDSLPVDLMVRTSGELRLSDFLLWQSSSSYIHFTKTLWPDFTVWDLLSAVFHYQRAKPGLDASFHKTGSPPCNKFLTQLYQSRLAYLSNLAADESIAVSS